MRGGFGGIVPPPPLPSLGPRSWPGPGQLGKSLDLPADTPASTKRHITQTIKTYGDLGEFGWEGGLSLLSPLWRVYAIYILLLSKCLGVAGSFMGPGQGKAMANPSFF